MNIRGTSEDLSIPINGKKNEDTNSEKTEKEEVKIEEDQKEEKSKTSTKKRGRKTSPARGRGRSRKKKSRTPTPEKSPAPSPEKEDKMDETSPATTDQHHEEPQAKRQKVETTSLLSKIIGIGSSPNRTALVVLNSNLDCSIHSLGKKVFIIIALIIIIIIVI